jgi:F-type H+-transporting ATPase subunit b
MLDFSVTFLITIANLAILYLILRRLLFKPVTDFMDKRSEAIRHDIDSAKNTRMRCESLEEELQTRIADMNAASQKAIAEVREKAEQERAALIVEAKRKARELEEKAKERIETERTETRKELVGIAAGLSIEAAGRLLGERLDSDRNRKLVNEFLDSLESE